MERMMPYSAKVTIYCCMGESDEDSDSESEDTLNITIITVEFHAEYNTPVSAKRKIKKSTSVIHQNVPAAVSARRREKVE
jgi:hypothetical protein